MKIQSMRAIEVDFNPQPTTKPRSPSRGDVLDMARPLNRYPGLADYGFPRMWTRTAVIVTAENGEWGFGLTVHGGPVARIINDHFAPVLVGQNCMATEALWDMMARTSIAYGNMGLTSYAISAVDVALWDLKGKLLGRPVYELLGGPQKEVIDVYATGFDIEWYLELGFKAVKVFAPHGPHEGLDGLYENVELVASTRELVGERVELAFDGWVSMDEEYTVRMAEMLKPYRIKWLEDYVHPDHLDAYESIRRRVPSQTLASGEHWYMPHTFLAAANRRVVDIFQPDVLWCGGITGAVKICHIAEAAGISVYPHASANYPFGQHLVYAMPAAVWGERSEGVSAPGVPLAEMTRLPGTPAVKNGQVVPSDAPGFGLEITLDWIQARVR